jgi:hypothetical protein
MAVVMVVAFAMFATSALAYTHTVTLKVGSSGSQVMALQTALGATADGVFGPATKAKVMAFQSANGLTADGVVGAMTGAKLAGGSTTGSTGGATCPNGNLLSNNCMPGSTTGSTGSLEGTDGTINDVDTLSSYSSEEVGEGEEDVKVAGFDLEASNDGDIAIKSLKLNFDQTGNAAGDSDHLDDYITGVSVWMGSTKVGSADVDDFSENSDDTFSKTITLSNAVVKADETEAFYITVDGGNSFDSSDIDSDSWTVNVSSIRYEDGSGVVSTDTTTGDLGASGTGIGTNGTLGDGVPMNFVSFSTAADTELKLSTVSSNPEAGIVVASNTGTTDDVVLLKGKMKLDGDSDVLLDEFPVTFSPTSSNFNVIASSIKLMIGNEEYSESVPSIAAAASATVTFDNLDYTIEAGDTVEFQVLAEIADTDDFTAGATVTASVTSTNRANLDVENEEGDQLAEGEKSGTVSGEALEFRANGITVSLVSTTATKSASDSNDADTATFTIKFKVTAVGDDVYVATTASTAGAMNNLYAVDYSGTATVTDVSGVLVNNTDTTVTSGLYLIEEGESETFTLTVLRNGSANDDLFRAALTSIKWDDEAGDTTPDNNYTTNLDDFKTDYVSLD